MMRSLLKALLLGGGVWGTNAHMGSAWRAHGAGQCMAAAPSAADEGTATSGAGSTAFYGSIQIKMSDKTQNAAACKNLYALLQTANVRVIGIGWYGGSTHGCHVYWDVADAGKIVADGGSGDWTTIAHWGWMVSQIGQAGQIGWAPGTTDIQSFFSGLGVDAEMMKNFNHVSGGHGFRWGTGALAATSDAANVAQTWQCYVCGDESCEKPPVFQPKTGDTAATYHTGGQADYRDYGSTSRDGVNSADSLSAPDGITGIPYNTPDTATNTRLKTGDSSGTYPSYGTPPNKGEGPFFMREGNTTYAEGLTSAGTTPWDTDSTTGKSCTAQGFMCDFSQVAEMTKKDDANPLDFVWKVVDPESWNKDPLEWQTLNCEVLITAGAQNAAQQYDHFYVPMGQENVGSTDYCDIEAVVRAVNDQSLNMTDTIKIRGESSRLNNQESTEYDLIGTQFDLICQCTTALSTEAKVSIMQPAIDLLTVMEATGQSRSLKIQLRLYKDDELTDEYEFGSGAYYPAGRPYFFFLVRHMFDNDWDAPLQINKCVACRTTVPQSKCNTKTPGKEAVIFYELCDTLLGGPRRIPVAPTSWYRDPSVATAFKNTTGKWASEDPDFCPYDVVGVQKFRLAGTESLKIVCAITGCKTRPCPPCEKYYGENRGSYSPNTLGYRADSDGSNIGVKGESVRQGAGDQFEVPKDMRRRRLAREQNASRRRRSLQEREVSQVDLAVAIGFEPGDSMRNVSNDDKTEGAKTERKKARLSIFLLVLMLLLLALSGYLMWHVIRKKRRETGAKSVTPDESSVGGAPSVTA